MVRARKARPRWGRRYSERQPWAGARGGLGLEGQPSLNLGLGYRRRDQKASCGVGQSGWDRVI